MICSQWENKTSPACIHSPFQSLPLSFRLKIAWVGPGCCSGQVVMNRNKFPHWLKMGEREGSLFALRALSPFKPACISLYHIRMQIIPL